jgi:Zn-dependent protease with chaperone function
MTELSGFYYDGRSSSRTTFTLHVDKDGCFRLPDGQLWRWRQVSVSARIGNSARYLDMPDGARFETQDNAAVDVLNTAFQASNSLAHRLESRTRYALIAVLLVILSATGFITYGIPAIASAVAYALPASATQSLGQHTLSVLDQAVFEPSMLDNDEQRSIAQAFDAMVARQHNGMHYALHFRRGGRIGANAFALPSGDIVITDELIALASHPDAIAGVLAHEIAHVEHRHLTRRMLQDSALPLVITAVTGDMSAATAVLATLPTIMVEAHYSRAFEEEADRFALQLLDATGRNPAHLATLLEKLDQLNGEERDSQDWLSSHPLTASRAEFLRQNTAE